MTGPMLFALIVVAVVAALGVAAALDYRRVQRRLAANPAALPGPTRGPGGKPREWMLWVGDGMAPAGPDLIGRPVNIDGRTGRVVDTTALQILVEWDDAP